MHLLSKIPRGIICREVKEIHFFPTQISLTYDLPSDVYLLSVY